MEIKKYPDGTSYVNAVNDSNEITFRVNTYEDLWHLNQYVDAYNSLSKNRLTVTIPNLIDAQADRRFKPYESSGLKLVCKFLNSMKADFRVFHPHNPEVVEALIDNVKIVNNRHFVVRVLEQITKRTTKGWDASNLILMSSDAGGFKSLMKVADGISWKGETASASKSRKYENEKTTLTQMVDREDYKGKDILIIDDICVYGGTFKGLSKLLKERNCGKLYLAVSHMTIDYLGEDPVTNYFNKVFTTNSKYEKYIADDYNSLDGHYTYNPQNLEIIKLF